jgi:hypothetical protein
VWGEEPEGKQAQGGGLWEGEFVQGEQAEEPGQKEGVLGRRGRRGRERVKGEEEDTRVGSGILVAELLLEVGSEEPVEGIQEVALSLLNMVK